MRSSVYQLLYSNSELDYARDFKRVLEKLRQYKLYANAEKSEFSLRELEILGHVHAKKRMHSLGS